MTYKEIKARLSKCELTLEKIKNGTYPNVKAVDVAKTKEKLEILRESYIKLLNEASEKTYLVTPKSGKTTALSLGDDEVDALKDADDIEKIKSSDGDEVKEQEGIRFSVEETKAIAKKVGTAVAKALTTLGDEVAHMKAKQIEEGSFEIYVQYKNDSDDQFSFYIVDDTLHLVDFSFDKEMVDVGVKPSGEAVVHVDVLANELVKHFKSMNETEVSEAPEGMYYIKVAVRDARKALAIIDDQPALKHAVEISGSDTYYLSDEELAYDLMMDFNAHDIEVIDNNIELDEASDYARRRAAERDYQPSKRDVPPKKYKEPKNDYFARRRKELDYKYGSAGQEMYEGDLDVGHQDDEPNMLKKDLYDVITYASKLYKALDKYDQHDGEVDFPHWWQKKVTLAREYMSAAQHYLEGEEKQPAIDQLALEAQSHPVMVQQRIAHAKKAKEKEKKTVKEDWGGSDQRHMNQQIHKALGEPTKMPSPFDDKLEYAVQDAVDFHWDDWPEYQTDREGLYTNAKRAYLRAYFKDTFNKMVQMFEPANEATEKEEEKFHKNLDTLVHKTFGKRKEELEEKESISTHDETLGKAILDLVDTHAATAGLSDDEAAKEVIEFIENQFGSNSLEEGTDLYDRNGISIKRYFGGQDKGVMVQITIGGKYITVPANEYPFLVRAMQSVQDDLKDMSRQVPRSKNMEEGFGKTKKAYDLVVSKMKELAKVYKSGDHSVVDQLKDLTAKKKKLEAMLDDEAGGIGAGQELDPNINERVGGLEEFISLIQDRAADTGFSEEEEAEEVIDAIKDHYGLEEVAEEYKGKHQGTNYKWPMSQATKDRKEADKKKTVKEEKATYCGRCKTTHKKSSGCPKK